MIIGNKKLIQVRDEFGYEEGLYLVPLEVTKEQFKEEWDRLRDDDLWFDDDNNIGAERVFVDDDWTA